MDTSSALAVAEALANKKELKKIDFNGEQNTSLPVQVCPLWLVDNWTVAQGFTH